MNIIRKYKYLYDTNFFSLSLKKRLVVVLRLLKRYLFRLKFPISIMIGLTYRCQYSCVHCCVASYSILEKKELTTEKIKELIDEAMELGICKVRFFGGEPLMRDDIFCLIKYASNKGLIASMDTNGYLLTSDVAVRLKESGICEVDISIDSSNPEVHDRLRGVEGSYQSAIMATKNCLKERIGVILSTYVTRDAIRRDDLPGVIEIGKSLGVKGIKILFPVATGKWFNNTEVVLNNDEKRYISKFIDSSFVFFEGQGNFNFKSCSMLKMETFYVSPYGDVQVCCFIPLTFGNIHTEKLQTIWERMSKSSLYTEGFTPCPMNDEKFRKKYICCS